MRVEVQTSDTPLIYLTKDEFISIKLLEEKKDI